MGGALGLRAAGCEPFGRGLSGAAREQPATVGVRPARTVGGVLRGPRGTRTANGRGVRPLGSSTRLEPSSADRPHLGWAYVVVAVWLPTLRRAQSVVVASKMGIKERERRVQVFFYGLFMDEELLRARVLNRKAVRSPPSTASPSASANEEESSRRMLTHELGH